MKKLNKKGLSLGQLVPAILTLVVLVVIITVGLKIGSDMRDQITSTKTSTEYQGSNNSLQSLVELADWSDLIGLVIAAAVILGLVLGAIALRAGRA